MRLAKSDRSEYNGTSGETAHGVSEFNSEINYSQFYDKKFSCMLSSSSP